MSVYERQVEIHIKCLPDSEKEDMFVCVGVCACSEHCCLTKTFTHTPHTKWRHKYNYCPPLLKVQIDRYVCYDAAFMFTSCIGKTTGECSFHYRIWTVGFKSPVLSDLVKLYLNPTIKHLWTGHKLLTYPLYWFCVYYYILQQCFYCIMSWADLNDRYKTELIKIQCFLHQMITRSFTAGLSSAAFCSIGQWKLDCVNIRLDGLTKIM